MKKDKIARRSLYETGGREFDETVDVSELK